MFGFPGRSVQPPAATAIVTEPVPLIFPTVTPKLLAVFILKLVMVLPGAVPLRVTSPTAKLVTPSLNFTANCTETAFTGVSPNRVIAQLGEVLSTVSDVVLLAVPTLPAGSFPCA